MNNWLTSTVFALCNSMRAQNDYAPLPILVDALEDAGCDDQGILDACRDPNITPVAAQRTVCLVLGGEHAGAVKWLDEFCTEFADYEYSDDYDWETDDDDKDKRIYGEQQVTYASLLESIAKNEAIHLGFQTPDIVYEQRERMWECVKLITGRDEPEWQWGRPGFYFSCAC